MGKPDGKQLKKQPKKAISDGGKFCEAAAGPGDQDGGTLARGVRDGLSELRPGGASHRKSQGRGHQAEGTAEAEALGRGRVWCAGEACGVCCGWSRGSERERCRRPGQSEVKERQALVDFLLAALEGFYPGE